MKSFVNLIKNKFRHSLTILNRDITSHPPIDDAVSNEAILLESRLKGAIQFLKTTRISRQNKPVKLNEFPWYLLIGQSESGKTSLLANSNLNFILEKLTNNQGNFKAVSSNQCDWWITNDLVLIDVPGAFTTLKSRKLSYTNKLWQAFIQSIVKWRGKDALSGVVITISLPELMQRQLRENLMDSLKYQIGTLKEQFGSNLPVYFVLTKCDMIPGFVDFFSDSSAEELAQAWGIPFADDATPANEAFVHRFNALIKRLNKQLIWRLHQERNPRAKVYIKDFPLQIERVKEALFELLTNLSQSNSGTCHIKGLYLTSALQPSYQEEQQQQAYPQTMSADAFQQSLQIMKAPEMPRQSYFIKQFFTHGLPSVKSVEGGWDHRALWSGMAAAVVFIALFAVGDVFWGQMHGTTQVVQSTISNSTSQQVMKTAASNSNLT